MTLVQEKDPQTGQATGALSTARILAWLFALASLAVWVFYLGGMNEDITFWRAVVGSGVTGVFSVGFYQGRAGGAFDRIADAVASRVGN